MIIKNGTLLKVKHCRKGTFLAMASREFDTDKEEFYPVKVAIKNGEKVEGLNNEWEQDESIPCRASLCEIEILKEK